MENMKTSFVSINRMNQMNSNSKLASIILLLMLSSGAEFFCAGSGTLKRVLFLNVETRFGFNT